MAKSKLSIKIKRIVSREVLREMSIEAKYMPEMEKMIKSRYNTTVTPIVAVDWIEDEQFSGMYIPIVTITRIDV